MPDTRTAKHRYRVVRVGEGVTAVSVGAVLVMPWCGKKHDLMTEYKGQLSYLCSVVHIEKATDQEARS